MVCFPTDKIIVDYSTKPTQGTLFKVHRNTIMGMSEDECGMCKGQCREVLQRHELWDEAESDLISLQIVRSASLWVVEVENRHKCVQNDLTVNRVLANHGSVLEYANV